ncbi:hypothetical protein KF840_05675 [bacterium]|nr:hypothetical protein [bacterium]
MRRILLIAALGIVATVAARPVSAAFLTGCCACLEQHNAQTASGPPQAQPALFCSQVVGMGYPDFVQRCDDAGGASAPCFDPSPGQSCGATLAQQGIGCPAAPGAPAAGHLGLAALAVALSSLGFAALRRRAR